jgi:sugar phosphate isomerase/epimerase
LNSVHAPICASLIKGQWGEAFSNAVPDDQRRRKAVAEAEAALAMARIIPYRYLVVHLGVPDSIGAGPTDNRRDAARRSIEELYAVATRDSVTLALEVIPNTLSSAEALVQFIEDELDGAGIGICLDVGHAFMMGDLGDAIETCSGHLVTTHLHDNHRKTDDHLAPGEGGIDWPSALMSLQKIGYEGPWLFEVANTSTTKAVLEKTEKACRRFGELLDLSFDNPANP